MSSKWSWFDRAFQFDFPLSKFPDILERLRGTPARVDQRLREIPTAILTRRKGETWSIQENIGHLADLETLWLGRVEDMLGDAVVMREADLTNRKTSTAQHNKKTIYDVAGAFRTKRSHLLARLELLTDKQHGRKANHPRLNKPMRVIDLCHFVAEHDDYHLARITELKKMFT